MIVPDVPRNEPPGTAAERPLLDAWLDYYRATLLHKCAGLTPDQLVERSAGASRTACAGPTCT